MGNYKLREGKDMSIRKSYSILFAFLFLLSCMLIFVPNNAQSQVQVMGCCQFEGDEGGCWYPADKDACANLEGTYFENAKCNAEVTKCVENKKDDSGSADKD